MNRGFGHNGGSCSYWSVPASWPHCRASQYHRNYITAEETKRKQEARYLIFLLLVCRYFILCRPYFSDSFHLPTDIRLRNLRIAPRHVRIRVAQYLGDDVDRHPVFDRKRRKRMSCAVRRQVLRYVAQRRNFFQIVVR